MAIRKALTLFPRPRRVLDGDLLDVHCAGVGLREWAVYRDSQVLLGLGQQGSTQPRWALPGDGL
jgi:hypothetical protein